MSAPSPCRPGHEAGDEVVVVVFSGEHPVAVYPEAATPGTELVGTADLSKRLTPEEFQAAKVSARAGRAVWGTANRARPSRRRAMDPELAA